MAWALFILHKALMVFIGYSSVRIVLGVPRWWHTGIVSGFLITQGIFGRCIVTDLENLIRTSSGYLASKNEFILHNIIPAQHIPFARVVFVILGIFLIAIYAEQSAWRQK